LSDAAGTQHTTTTQSEEQVQVSMASADDWSAFAEDLNADTPGMFFCLRALVVSGGGRGIFFTGISGSHRGIFFSGIGSGNN
ncbi:hypothetical protein ACSLPA_34205, partial [Escherichia coli]